MIPDIWYVCGLCAIEYDYVLVYTLPDFILATCSTPCTVVFLVLGSTKYFCIQPDHTIESTVNVTGIRMYMVKYLSLLCDPLY